MLYSQPAAKPNNKFLSFLSESTERPNHCPQEKALLWLLAPRGSKAGWTQESAIFQVVLACLPGSRLGYFLCSHTLEQGPSFLRDQMLCLPS